MAAKIVTVSPGLVWTPPEPARLWFFPDGSQYLKYAPHFHMIQPGGFRQNLPLSHMFVVILEGKLSIKDYYGRTFQRIVIRDQVWYKPGETYPAKLYYAWVTSKTKRRR